MNYEMEKTKYFLKMCKCDSTMRKNKTEKPKIRAN